MSAFPGFWDFSLALYARDGVAESCLALQDEQGVDVNILFLFVYLAFCGRSLNALQIAAIDAAVAPWRLAVVAPLREVRRYLKAPPEIMNASAAQSLRTDVKRIELEAERVQQLALESAFPVSSTGTAAPVRDALTANLEAYSVFMGGLTASHVQRVREAALAMVAGRAEQ